MTAPFDWAGLRKEIERSVHAHGWAKAFDLLRTRIEAAFVPVEVAKALMDEKHKEAAEAKLWFEKAQEWRGELTAASARAEAAEAENARLGEALQCIAKLPASIAQSTARQALGGEHEHG